MISRLADRLLLRHSFVASCVVSLWISTRLALGHALEFEPELLVLFLGSSAYYDLHVHSYTVSRDGLVELMIRFWPGLLVSGSTIIYALFDCPPIFVVLLLLCLLLAVAYSVPVFMGFERDRRLRERPVLKIAVVGFAYAIMTVLVPCLDTPIPPDTETILVLFAQRLVFIACLCIPFEVRDRLKEHSRGVRSLMDLGDVRVRVIGVVLMSAACLSLFYIHLHDLLPRPLLSADLVVYSITMFWIVFSREDWPEWVYTYLVDGTMLLSPFLIILFMQWQ